MKDELVVSIQTAHGLALLLGLFNFSYDGVRHKFREEAILSFYNLCCRWIVRILALCLVWAYLTMLAGFKDWENTAEIQDRALWFINIVQLYLGVFFTYNNHSLNQSHLLLMLNRIVKCNRNLVRLLGPDIRLLRPSYLGQRIRIATGILDIFITCCRPTAIQMITFEWKILAVFSKVILTSSFLGQHHVQTFLGTSFDRLECFLRARNGATISAGELRLLSKICSQLHKIRLSSNEYHGAFGLISYLGAIRAVCFFYSCFSALFTTGIMRIHDSMYMLISYFVWMLVPGLAVLVDIALLGIAAGAVQKSVKGLYLRVYLFESKSAVSAAVSQLIGIILRLEHLHDMRTLISTGVQMDRSFALDVVYEAWTWVIVFFVYNGGRVHDAILITLQLDLRVKWFMYLVLLSACAMCGFCYCIRCCECKRMNVSWCGDESD